MIMTDFIDLEANEIKRHLGVGTPRGWAADEEGEPQS